jgi:glycosyltransferase involved in cell wall biosynthesis
VTRERIVAVVPAYQAADTVADVVERARRVVERVLVVDDGSTDRTSQAAASAGADVLRHEVNRGKGAALVTAFESLRDEDVDAVLTIDADGQHLPEEAHKLIGETDAALVLGVRSHLFDEMSPVRRASNRTSSWLISRLAGVDIDDVQTGFRLYRRPLFDPPLIRPGRFESESGVFVRAARRGLEVRAVPVEMAKVDGRGTSHYRPLVDSLRIARAVAGARWGP